MKICHITSVHPRYDIRIFVKECQSLATKHQVNLIVADSLGNEEHSGVNIYDVGKVSGGRLTRMRVTSRLIFQKIIELSPEIVHFHDPELLGIGRKLAKLGFKVIYDVHEDVPKQVMNKHWIPRLLRPIISKYVEFQERSASSLFAGVICATEIIANRFKLYNANSCAVHNYPILAELNQSQVEWHNREDCLCYIGSISETRGIIPLVDSLAISGLSLELAGPFSNDVVRAKLELNPNYGKVNYRGILKRNEISQLLAKVRFGMVTLLPTPSYVESLPIKLFEYMLAGIPVIASNFKLWEPIVLGHNCGLLVDPQNPEAIADACTWLKNNPQEARQMGENGRKAVLEHYTWDCEKLKLLEFYQKLN